MRSYNTENSHARSQPSSSSLLASVLAGYWSKARRRAAYRRTVKQLSRLDDRTLKDIGLVRTEIYGVAQVLAERED